MLSGVYTSNLFNDLDFYLGQILSLYEAKYLGQIFSQTFCFIEGQYLAQIKIQIFKQIGCVDAALFDHKSISYPGLGRHDCTGTCDAIKYVILSYVNKVFFSLQSFQSSWSVFDAYQKELFLFHKLPRADGIYEC